MIKKKNKIKRNQEYFSKRTKGPKPDRRTDDHKIIMYIKDVMDPESRKYIFNVHGKYRFSIKNLEAIEACYEDLDLHEGWKILEHLNMKDDDFLRVAISKIEKRRGKKRKK